LTVMTRKFYKARSFILGFCFLFGSFIISFFEAPAASAQGRFRIYPANDIYADSALTYLEDFHDILADLLDMRLDTVVSVYLASSEDEFTRVTGSSIPDWGAGVALMEKNAIIIKSPKFIRVGKSFRELLGHELTHIMLYRAAGERWLPRWIHEGLAMRISGEWNIGQDVLVARAAWTNSLVQLYQLEGMSMFSGAKANLAYTESYLAVSSLLRGKDRYVLADLLALYRDTGDFQGSFKLVAGKDYSQWINDWYERTSMQYHFLLFIFDSKIFWIMVPLFFLFLFFLKMRQNARVRRKWEIDERLNPPDDSYKQYFDGYYDEENQV
jgi:hypothetical protein